MNPFIRPSISAVVLASALAGVISAQPRSFQPAGDDKLRNPSPADWLHWRGNGASWGYSPLDQINRQNVGQLQLAWAWQMEPGNQQAAPVVHNGVMYLPGPGGIVQALDGATGDLLWEHSHQPAEGTRPGSAVRGLSLYGDKVFLNTDRCADCGTRRTVRPRRLECSSRGSQEGVLVPGRISHREGEGHFGPAGLQSILRGEVRNHGTRREYRPGSCGASRPSPGEASRGTRPGETCPLSTGRAPTCGSRAVTMPTST